MNAPFYAEPKIRSAKFGGRHREIVSGATARLESSLRWWEVESRRLSCRRQSVYRGRLSRRSFGSNEPNRQRRLCVRHPRMRRVVPPWHSSKSQVHHRVSPA